MEVLGETPPPLPPKTKISNGLLNETEYKMKNSNNIFPRGNGTSISIAPKNGFEAGSLKIVNNRRRDEDSFAPPQSQVSERRATESQSERIAANERLSKNETIVDVRRSVGESKNETFGPKIITWGSHLKKGGDYPAQEELYENVSNGVNYLENRLKNIADKSERSGDGNNSRNVERSQGKRKTPKIEVLQEENKTVVKISVKDSATPEEEINGENLFKAAEENIYENGFQDSKGFTSLVYENCDKIADEGEIYENADVLVEDERCYENMSSNCYENVEADGSGERFYANVSQNGGHCNRGPKKELITEANYCNLNGDDSKCDQVYKNRDFQVSKNNVVSIISKNSTPSAKNQPKREDGDDESYENVKSDYHIYSNENLYRNGQKMTEKKDETAEKFESRKREEPEMDKKSSVIEVFLQKPSAMVKVEKQENECNIDDNSSGDLFDSGTCSDVDSLPNFAQTKKGNVIVTIKSLQNEEKMEDLKKNESGHRRAESLTSSGVGVDSEESDDEKSNISCDSLNSSEPYPQSNSEDHGYHTPNSEDKTGSPIDQMVYENVMKTSSAELKLEKDKGRIDFLPKDDCEKTDIIQQVANASQKIKNLRMENSGVYMAKLIEPADFDEYENVHVFEQIPKVYKKKPAPPPPPPPAKPSMATLHRLPEGFATATEEENKKSLPKNLLQDIRSRNVRLSSTYPSGERPESVNNSVANAIFNFEANLSGKGKPKVMKPFAGDPKELMVEQRTYEERKNEVRRVKVNNICAIEVDTDKFYKFHLAENVRNNVKEEDKENDEETFAGIKDYLSREKPAAITSAKGTIRGVKNRVKAGIATFLQLHENKTYKDKDAGKVVVYTTTMGIVRETYHKCLKVKQILRTLMVKFEERDVFMSSEAQEEIRERMKSNVILVPQVFVEGQHIGDAETIERLNEIGELRTILKPYKSPDACSTCKVCGGYRLLPCSICKGSKKSIHRNHFTAEFVSLKCMNCDQVGLTKCHAC